MTEIEALREEVAELRAMVEAIAEATDKELAKLAPVNTIREQIDEQVAASMRAFTQLAPKQLAVLVAKGQNELARR